MKCLLRSSIFDNEEDVIENYISYHNADANNRLFSNKVEIVQYFVSAWGVTIS